MSETIYAAVDLGAESGRVLAARFDGARVQLQEAHRFPNLPARANNTLYWDVLRLWNEIQQGLKRVGELSRDANLPVVGIGVDTWGVDFGLLDVDGNLLGNPVHYRDARTNGMIERGFERVPRAEFFAGSGLQFMFFNSVYQLMALSQREDAALRNAHHLLFMPDLLNFWLTGERVNEYTISSTSALLEPRSRTWNTDLMARLNISTEPFGRILPPGQQIGTLRPEVAESCGLPVETPVFSVGSHDTASAVAAVPAQGENWAFLSSGTWSLMGLEVPAPIISPRVEELNFTNEGGVADTIRFLKNIAGLWLVQGVRNSFLRRGQELSYAELAQLAEAAPAFKSLIEPDAARFAAPADMCDAIAEFCRDTQQNAPQTPGEYARCCLESLALKYRRVWNWLEEVRGENLDVLHIVGGGTQNRLLSQWTSDCLNALVLAGPIEATAIGNALTQAMANGQVRDLAHLRAIVRASFEIETFTPNTNARQEWDAAYERFLKFENT